MLAQLIEKKMVDSISAVIPDDVDYQIIGTWQPTTSGYVKNKIDIESDVIIVVSLGTM